MSEQTSLKGEAQCENYETYFTTDYTSPTKVLRRKLMWRSIKNGVIEFGTASCTEKQQWDQDRKYAWWRGLCYLVDLGDNCVKRTAL